MFLLGAFMHALLSRTYLSVSEAFLYIFLVVESAVVELLVL